ncbi:MAG: AAA family ATPase [Methanobacteriaceae archaeon]|nr:AAA family ATPase [Methanobacteriaceae archaeon]
MKNNNQIEEINPSNNMITTSKFSTEKEAKAVVLKGVGYPFNFALMEGSNLEISDKVLFEQYAREQWLGTIVKEGNYLFDQKIIPDFAFKVITAFPNNSVIGKNTSIIIVDNEKTNHTLKAIKTDYTLSDVVGQVSAKNKAKVIMKYLANPEKFGEWAPRNILFYGLPGTGKTMLAKALSNELNVPLYLIKATSLIGDHVGDGAYKISELFDFAQKTSPSVIFIDEIDAIALHRTYQSLRGDVSEIVNSLLTEMDGINPNKGVITIGATNNIETLDYAVRSRFEEEIEFKIPNEEERKQIIQNNLKTFPLKIEVPIEKLVKISKGMSGRDIKQKLLKTSLHNAISNDKETVTMEDIEYALNYKKQKANEVKNMFA